MRTQQGRERLAELVRERRIERYGTVEAAIRAAGINRQTWERVEEAQPIRPTKLQAVEAALGWHMGSAEDVMAGGEPTEAAPERTGYDPEPAPGGSSLAEIDQHYQMIYRRLEESDVPVEVRQRAKAAIDYNYRQAIEAALSRPHVPSGRETLRETGS